MWTQAGRLAVGTNCSLLVYTGFMWRQAKWEIYSQNRQWYLTVVAQKDKVFPRSVISRQAFPGWTSALLHMERLQREMQAGRAAVMQAMPQVPRKVV